jgi:hypothetical protein
MSDIIDYCLAPDKILPCSYEIEGMCLNSGHCNYKNNIPLINEKRDILAPGTVILSGNFILVKKIEDLNEFWDVLSTQKSFYARHRMYPTSFYQSWTIRTIVTWIKSGYFWTTVPVDKHGRNNIK